MVVIAVLNVDSGCEIYSKEKVIELLLSVMNTKMGKLVIMMIILLMTHMTALALLKTKNSVNTTLYLKTPY